MHRDELTRWVGDTDAFLDGHWRTAPAVFRPGTGSGTGTAAGPAAPLSLEEIDAAVAGGLLRVPHLELARAGDPVHSSRYTRSRTVAGVTTPATPIRTGYGSCSPRAPRWCCATSSTGTRPRGR